MILNLEEQTSLTSLMENQHGKVKSESGGNEQGLMESSKIRRGNLQRLMRYNYYLQVKWNDDLYKMNK